MPRRIHSKQRTDQHPDSPASKAVESPISHPTWRWYIQLVKAMHVLLYTNPSPATTFLQSIFPCFPNHASVAILKRHFTQTLINLSSPILHSLVSPSSPTPSFDFAKSAYRGSFASPCPTTPSLYRISVLFISACACLSSASIAANSLTERLRALSLLTGFVSMLLKLHQLVLLLVKEWL